MAAEARPSRSSWVPPPPSVIYLSSATAGIHDKAPSQPAPVAPPPLPASAAPDPIGPVPAQPLDASSVEPVPLGPPPLYRPVGPARRQASHRAGRPSPAQAEIPINVRVASALGPPPPYRPIIQGEAVFQRGPAPDLEPWRTTSLIRMAAPEPERSRDLVPGDTDPDGSEWRLIREAEPAVFATPEIGPGLRLEIGRDFEPDSEPAPWHPATRPLPPRWSQGGRPGLVARMMRPALWCTAIVVAMAVTGIILDIARDEVMRRVPATTEIYAAVGLVSARPATNQTAAPCEMDRPADSTTGPRAECGDENAAEPSK